MLLLLGCRGGQGSGAGRSAQNFIDVADAHDGKAVGGLRRFSGGDQIVVAV